MKLSPGVIETIDQRIDGLMQFESISLILEDRESGKSSTEEDLTNQSTFPIFHRVLTISREYFPGIAIEHLIISTPAYK